jgi:hypothetical protein
MNARLLFRSQLICFQPKLIQPDLHPPLAFIPGQVHDIGSGKQVRGDPAKIAG